MIGGSKRELSEDDLRNQRHDHVVNSKLDPVFATKVRELLAVQRAPEEARGGAQATQTWSMKAKAALLEPPVVSKSAAQLSPLIRQGRAAISTLNEGEVDSIRVPF